MASWYWNRDNFEGLSQLARRFATEPATSELGRHYLLREQGLRRESFRALERFLKVAREWTESHRRQFVEGLIELHLDHPEVHQLLSTPLTQGLLLPVLLRWRESEPNDASPLTWLAALKQPNSEALLRRAVELDPANPRARSLLVEYLLQAVDFDHHHLPHEYLGDPLATLQSLEEASRLATPQQLQGIEERRQLIGDWLQFQVDSQEMSFSDWCQARARSYRWSSTSDYHAE